MSPLTMPLKMLVNTYLVLQKCYHQDTASHWQTPRFLNVID
jgi:hypothetical protein